MRYTFQFQGSGGMLVKHCRKESSTAAAAASVTTAPMLSTSASRSPDCCFSRWDSACTYASSTSCGGRRGVEGVEGVEGRGVAAALLRVGDSLLLLPRTDRELPHLRHDLRLLVTQAERVADAQARQRQVRLGAGAQGARGGVVRGHLGGAAGRASGAGSSAHLGCPLLPQDPPHRPIPPTNAAAGAAAAAAAAS
jgi:hypothetical protein